MSGRLRTPRALRTGALGALLLGTLALPAAMPAAAPRAVAQAQGVISGHVRNGTAGVPGTPGVLVQLIAVRADAELSMQEQRPSDGRFRFFVDADPTISYLLRTVYQGVPYLSEPLLLVSPELPGAARDVVVYERASEPPPLRITSTVISLRGLDPAAGTLELQREDEVENPSDRAWAGDADAVTLRIPAPAGTRAVSDLGGFATVALRDGVVTTTQPLLPGRQVLVTQLTAAYDAASAGYRLRVTAPLPTAHVETWLPERFLERVTPQAGARSAGSRTLEGERWLVVERAGELPAGESLVVEIAGLGGRRAVNPLTGRWGSAVAATLAIVVVGGGPLLLLLRAPAARRRAGGAS